MIIERLSRDNFEKFNELYNLARSNNNYRLDFYEIYNDKSFIVKYFIRKNTRLIIYEGKYIGYVWAEKKNNSTITIRDMFIIEDYYDKFNKYFLKILQSEYVLYDCFENEKNLALLNVLNMKKVNITNIMRFDKGSYKEDHNFDNKDISFPQYIKRKDAKIRCLLQNSIFENNKRTPLTVEDIYYDEEQEYFLDGFALFLKVRDNYAGYGQIVYSRGIYIIVNFGIVKEYRHCGLGKIFLYKLLSLAKEKLKEDVYIRVGNTNVPAIKLYKSCGFTEEGIISTWIYQSV